MNEMRKVITLMIAERKKCRKAYADLENVIQSLQREGRVLFNDMITERMKIESLMNTFMSAFMPVKDDIDKKYLETCEFRKRLRDVLIELASFINPGGRDGDKERWIAYFNKRLNWMLGGEKIEVDRQDIENDNTPGD
jgi:hypothetical protein